MKKRDYFGSWRGLAMTLLAAAVMVLVLGDSKLSLYPEMAEARDYIENQPIFAYETGWDGVTVGSLSYSGVFYGADTCQWITWWGVGGLSPLADDYELCFRADTTVGAVTDTLRATLISYPIVAYPGDPAILNHPNAKGQVLWEKGIYLTETTTGRSSNGFTFNPDSTFAFHSTTWWSGMNVLGTLTRGVTTATDSLGILYVWPQYLHQN